MVATRPMRVGVPRWSGLACQKRRTHPPTAACTARVGAMPSVRHIRDANPKSQTLPPALQCFMAGAKCAARRASQAAREAAQAEDVVLAAPPLGDAIVGR